MMRGEKSTWKSAKMTYHFAEVKALVYVILRTSNKGVMDTQWIASKVKGYAEGMEFKATYKMVLESLNELKEQGLVDATGNSYGYYWWSRERLS